MGKSIRRVGLGVILWAALGAGMAWAQPGAPQSPDVVIRGVMTRADHQTYRDLPFTVPAGVGRLTVTFAYTGRDQHATLDIGLYDPERFRGWSGGNKASFTLSAADATPSYLPGPIRPGRWRLVIGAPNIRPGGAAAYTATIRFASAEAAPAVSTFSDRPLRSGPAWYRGDLHLHTAHSDGTCPAQSGAMVPCPVFKTLEAAAARGLDFVAVTDHNTTSQDQDLRELQPYFDRLLLIPGQEVTTFHGHANVFGLTQPVDFRAATEDPRGLGAILTAVERAGGLIAINHPALPSGEVCMGCGWSPTSTDFSRIQAVEVINGGAVAVAGGLADSPLSGLAFWQARLNAGDRLTAIGGSDNHTPATDLARAGSVGSPATVVWADDLSERAILAAIRAGHVFVDVEPGHDRLIEVTATAGGRAAMMGDALPAPAGATVRLIVHGVRLRGARWVMIEDGQPVGAGGFAANDEDAAITVAADRARHWLRVEVRSTEGRLLLIGNPIFLAP